VDEGTTTPGGVTDTSIDTQLPSHTTWRSSLHQPAGLAGYVLLLVAILVAAGVAGAVVVDRIIGGQETAPIYLEPANHPGPNPFLVLDGPPDLRTAVTTLGLTSGNVTLRIGTAPGIYGGSGSDGWCDPALIAEFLRRNRPQAQAWAAVAGIRPNQIDDYLGTLTPVHLLADTLVTNHGFVDGEATPRQAILQAGTVVLVDQEGIPRVRCRCGNPLSPPQTTNLTAARFVGEQWDSFVPGSAQVITRAPDGRTVDEFTLVSLDGTGQLIRPTGTNGDHDQSTGSENDPADVDNLATAPDSEPTAEPDARCEGDSRFGVSYRLPGGIEWRHAETEPGIQEVYYTAGVAGISSVSFSIEPGLLLEQTVADFGVEATEVEVPGSPRAVRFFLPASDSGDGVSEMLLVEVDGSTIQAAIYAYIVDFDEFTIEDLGEFLDSICVDQIEAPAETAAPQNDLGGSSPESTTTASNSTTNPTTDTPPPSRQGREIVITDPESHPRTGPEVVFYSPDEIVWCVLWESSFLCDALVYEWELPGGYVEGCDNGVVAPEEYLDVFSPRVSASSQGAEFACASGSVGLTYGIASPTPVEAGDSLTFASTRCDILSNGVRCLHESGNGVLLTSETVKFLS